MDCKTFKSHIEPYLKNGAVKLSAAGEQHLQNCTLCRNRYGPQLKYDDQGDKIISDSAEIKGLYPSIDDLLDQFPDMSDPVEFKAAPITFTLHLDERIEEIKVVEPKVDYPLPKGGRLEVREKDACWADVVFKFNPESARPYELHFAVKAGIAYAEPHILTYGNSEVSRQGFNAAYTEEIIEQGGVKAWIEMSRGTARIYIHHT